MKLLKSLLLLFFLFETILGQSVDPLFSSACNGNGTEFLVFDTKRAYSGSRELCTRNGAIIARIDTIEDFQLVQSLIADLTFNVWVGLRDQSSNDGSGTDRFKYEDLVEDNRDFFDVGIGNFPWLEGQPSTCNFPCVNDQNCAEMRPADAGLWNNNECGFRGNGYVCRRPCNTDSPTRNPTVSPTASPTKSPTTPIPTISPTTSPSRSPTNNPTLSPTTSPTNNPTQSPTNSPTTSPSRSPTLNPTLSPTTSPTNNPTQTPTNSPTDSPSQSPTLNPTLSPTTKPTKNPTLTPTASPTAKPSIDPTASPTSTPTQSPTQNPSVTPTNEPTSNPTETRNPTVSPTISPTTNPTTPVPVTSPPGFFESEIAGFSAVLVVSVGSGISLVLILLTVVLTIRHRAKNTNGTKPTMVITDLGDV